MKDNSPAKMASIVTPTYGRAELLPALWACIRSQSWPNLEWLVEDDSPEPSLFMQSINDARVHYSHHPARHSIGEKRNMLIARAKGEYIVHFDDDDFYAPQYIDDMIRAIDRSGAEFCKLSGFFLYYKQSSTLAYWDMMVKTGVHYKWAEDALIPILVTVQNNADLAEMHMGFGFSYVYKRSVWESVPFTDRNMHEDSHFIAAASRTRRILLRADTTGLCLHLLHGANTSGCFPQFILPPFMVRTIFPKADAHLRQTGTPDSPHPAELLPE